jgi:hypothetical protein
MCNEIKKHDEFSVAENRWDGFRAYCRDCERKYGLEYARSEKGRRKQAEYMSTPQYYERLKIRYRKKMDTIPEYKLERYLRNNIYNGITGNGYVREADFITMVGMTPIQLRQYLESLFTDGMSWDNYERRGWHVDHDIPMHAFDKSNPIQQLACSYYKNLRPMWGRPNIQKGANYNIEDFENYMKWFTENVINKK